MLFRRLLAGVLLLLSATCVGCRPEMAAPPVAAIRPVQDTYFGTTVTDPYRWMENLQDPAVQTWLRKEADYTTAALNHISGHAALLARIRALGKGATYVGSVQQDGPYVFYVKRCPRDVNYKLYVRDGFGGSDRLLIDPETLSTGAVHVSLAYFAPSLNGNYVAYGLAPGGSENTTLHVLATDTGKTLDDTISRTQFGGVSWLPDGRSFVYNRLQKLAPGQNPNDKEIDSKVYRHVLGTDPDTQDTALLGKPESY